MGVAGLYEKRRFFDKNVFVTSCCKLCQIVSQTVTHDRRFGGLGGFATKHEFCKKVHVCANMLHNMLRKVTSFSS